jgi:hypothetical protein
MTQQLPEVIPNIILESKSMRYFESKLPEGWRPYKPEPDYGRDLVVELVVNGQAIGNDLIFQLKASDNPSGNPEYETVDLKVSTYNYLMNDVRVALIVKYIAQEDEAYWEFLRDCDPPTNQEQETFRLHIKRSNRLSEINWNSVVERSTNIYLKKIQATKGL